MKKALKPLSLLISLLLIISLFSGCANNGSGENIAVKGDYGDTGGLKLPLTEDGTEISALITDTGNLKINDSSVIQELRKRTGINLNVIPVSSATLVQQTSVMVASGDNMPDIFNNALSWQDANDFGMQGAFEEITQHIDKLPNFKRIFFDETEKYNTVGALNYMYAGDDGLYMFPKYDTALDVTTGILMYRKDIFDKHGLKEWTNQEEFYETLKKLKELYPKSSPFVVATGTGIIDSIAGYSGLRFPQEYYDEESGKWQYGGTNEKIKEVIDFVKKLYDEKLLDAEFLTMTQNALTANLSQESKSFVTISWIGKMDQLNTQNAGIVPGYNMRAALPIGKGKMKSTAKVSAGPVIKKSKNSLLAMKLCDYLLSPSGTELMTMGIEGTTYNLDEKGMAKYVGFEDKVPSTTELQEKYGLYSTGLFLRTDRRSAYFNLTETQAEAIDKLSKKGFWQEDPKLRLTKEESDTINSILVDLGKGAEEFAVKYILNNGTDKDWEDWLKKAEKMGVNKLLDALNKAQARYDAEL